MCNNLRCLVFGSPSHGRNSVSRGHARIKRSFTALGHRSPMPMFCLFSYLSHRRWLKGIASERKNVQQEWTRLMLPIIKKFERLDENEDSERYAP